MLQEEFGLWTCVLFLQGVLQVDVCAFSLPLNRSFDHRLEIIVKNQQHLIHPFSSCSSMGRSVPDIPADILQMHSVTQRLNLDQVVRVPRVQ